MTLTEVATVGGIAVSILIPTFGWARERRKDRAVTRRAEVGVDLDVVTVTRGLLAEQRTIHAQEVAFLRARLADCLAKTSGGP